jgi:ADP-heptose:LPS heptosyltransferase
MGALRQHAIKNEKDQVRLHQLCIEAVAFYADAIGSQHVDNETKADCLNNHGLIMGRMGFPEKAKIAFHLALQLNPEHRAARLNFADVLVFEGEYDAADREFFEVINSDPNSAGAQFCRSMILLLTGEIRRGFRDYRARFNVPTFPSKIMSTDKPMWDGQSLDGKTLCISQEQGWGDAIMFCRYAEEIKKRWPDCRILFSVAESLHLLLSGAVGLDECLPDHLTPEFKAEFDYHAPLLHLPDIMGTTIETIPNNCPYIMAQPDWINLPLKPTDKPRVGLCWAGSPIHGKDKFRSMKPEHFQRFIDAASHRQFYSLQCGPRAYEVQSMTNCVDLAQHIHDWTQTAAAMLQMDLIISVDTAIAHLAGALGIPCWVLLPSSPDFRWMLGRDDSPWYPKARLFRQELRDDWEPVIQKVCEAL